MKHPRWILAGLFAGALTVAVAAVQMQKKGGTDDTGPYTPVADWLKPVRTRYLERGEAVFVESRNRIIYTTDLEFPVPPPRGPATGWGMYGVGAGEFHDPHNLSVDSAGNLYVSIYSSRKVGLEKFAPQADALRSRLVGPAFNRTLPATPAMALATS